MALTTIWCCLRDASVTAATNRDQEVVAVVCPELQAEGGTCRLRANAVRSGFFLDLLLREDGQPADVPQPGCRLVVTR
jgi:hypothetical protein